MNLAFLIPGKARTSMQQDEANRAVYHTPGVYRYYLSTALTPPETACLLKYQPYFAGRDVLDIGVGAGRTSRYLAPLARRYEAVDYSPVMVQYMKESMQEVSVHHADFRDLGIFDAGSFDFIFATDNVIDALSHQDRLRALRESARVLRSGGILAFSSHNIQYKNAFSKPRFQWSLNPSRFVVNCAKYTFSLWNHLHIASMRTTGPEYALLNDPGHFYACLHYYTDPATVRSQLSRSGMKLVEVFDHRGDVARGNDVKDAPSLLYIAERLT